MAHSLPTKARRAMRMRLCGNTILMGTYCGHDSSVRLIKNTAFMRQESEAFTSRDIRTAHYQDRPVPEGLDAFVAKYNAIGIAQWVAQFGTSDVAPPRPRVPSLEAFTSWEILMARCRDKSAQAVEMPSWHS